MQKASARKSGRNPSHPYVPVIEHSRLADNGVAITRTEQLRGLAYMTRAEAVTRAIKAIADRKLALEHRLAEPRHRALRAQHGLPPIRMGAVDSS